MIDTVINYAKEHAFNLVLIVVIALVARKLLQTISNTVVHKFLKENKFKNKREMVQREDTLNSILSYVIMILVWLIAGASFLSELGIDIAPLIASAGIVGIALGFGAQSIVRDYLAGIFILTENQYRVGDVIKLYAGTEVSGSVEHISLRQTVLRDLDGQVHYVSNGLIEVATNMTMEHANVNLDIGVGYNSNIDKVEKVINQVGKSLVEDEAWKDKIIEAPKFLRVNQFRESSIEIKITGKTEPLQQWAITGELRRRLKTAFDKEGIELPLPQRVIHQAKKQTK